jgi:hypothetical protein
MDEINPAWIAGVNLQESSQVSGFVSGCPLAVPLYPNEK